jgi:chromosome segregation ATPase
MSTHEEEPISHESLMHDPTRPHSFDLTLELERQLAAESRPSSPARPEGRPQSLDTHVLASLVTSLRINVADLSKERDGLSAALEAARGRVSDLSLEVRQLKGAQAERDTELAALRQKIRDDEESIVLLRSKVEESRFGLSLFSIMPRTNLIICKVVALCDCKLKVVA